MRLLYTTPFIVNHSVGVSLESERMSEYPTATCESMNERSYRPVPGSVIAATLTLERSSSDAYTRTLPSEPPNSFGSEKSTTLSDACVEYMVNQPESGHLMSTSLRPPSVTNTWELWRGLP